MTQDGSPDSNSVSNLTFAIIMSLNLNGRSWSLNLNKIKTSLYWKESIALSESLAQQLSGSSTESSLSLCFSSAEKSTSTPMPVDLITLLFLVGGVLGSLIRLSGEAAKAWKLLWTCWGELFLEDKSSKQISSWESILDSENSSWASWNVSPGYSEHESKTKPMCSVLTNRNNPERTNSPSSQKCLESTWIVQANFCYSCYTI